MRKVFDYKINTNTPSSQTTNTIIQNLYLIAIKYKY